MSIDDDNLWKTHEVDDVEPVAVCPWPGSDQLPEEALFLVPENMPAGKVNGKRLVARSPLHSELGSVALLVSLSGVKLGTTEEAAITEEQKIKKTCGKPCISVLGRA